MADNILDTIVIAFGEDVSEADKADFYAKIILDTSLNLDLSGEVKTSFNPGDQAHILLGMTPGWHITSIKETSGMATLNGVVSRSYTQEKVFFQTTEDAGSLSFFPTGSVSGSFYGNTCSFGIEEREITALTAPVIVDLSYSYRPYSITITPPSITLGEGESWPIGVVIWVDK